MPTQPADDQPPALVHREFMSARSSGDNTTGGVDAGTGSDPLEPAAEATTCEAQPVMPTTHTTRQASAMRKHMLL